MVKACLWRFAILTIAICIVPITHAAALTGLCKLNRLTPPGADKEGDFYQCERTISSHTKNPKKFPCSNWERDICAIYKENERGCSCDDSIQGSKGEIADKARTHDWFEGWQGEEQYHEAKRQLLAKHLPKQKPHGATKLAYGRFPELTREGQERSRCRPHNDPALEEVYGRFNICKRMIAAGPSGSRWEVCRTFKSDSCAAREVDARCDCFQRYRPGSELTYFEGNRPTREEFEERKGRWRRTNSQNRINAGKAQRAIQLKKLELEELRQQGASEEALAEHRRRIKKPTRGTRVRGVNRYPLESGGPGAQTSQREQQQAGINHPGVQSMDVDRNKQTQNQEKSSKKRTREDGSKRGDDEQQQLPLVGTSAQGEQPGNNEEGPEKERKKRGRKKKQNLGGGEGGGGADGRADEQTNNGATKKNNNQQPNATDKGAQESEADHSNRMMNMGMDYLLNQGKYKGGTLAGLGKYFGSSKKAL